MKYDFEGSVKRGEFARQYVGKLNIYTCEKCRRHIVTKDVDPGVTPFMISCKPTHGCDGMMKSSMYRVFDQSMREDWQWYRPSVLEAGSLSDRDIQWLNEGHTLLRRALP